MGRNTVLNSIATVVTNAINAQGITQGVDVGVGWPVATQIVSIFQQGGGKSQVSIYPLPHSRNVTRNRPEFGLIPKPTITLTASVSGNVITFAGTPQGGLNVHAFPDLPHQDAVYQTTGADTLTSIASGLASALTSQAGYAATASGASVTVTSAKTLRVNIGGSQLQAVIAAEVGRMETPVQVTVWAPDDVMRWTLAEAIEMGVGQANSMFWNAPDGTDFSMKLENVTWDDESQGDYTLYKAHLVFTCEYGITQTVSATQVESVIATTTDGSLTNVGYSAGP